MGNIPTKNEKKIFLKGIHCIPGMHIYLGILYFLFIEPGNSTNIPFWDSFGLKYLTFELKTVPRRAIPSCQIFETVLTQH